MDFLRNTWYPAAWSEEVKRALFMRTILAEPVLMYRKEDGTAVAVNDTCPHRFAPLHKGKLIGDVVQCAYHGLQFNCAGACVKNPHGEGKIPAAAKIKTYPLVERFGMLWIWMGEAEAANPDSIPEFSCLDEPATFAYTAGHVIRMPLRYELVIDNLLDLTHAAYLHPENLGSDAVAHGVMSVTQSGNSLQIDNSYPDGEPAPVFVLTGACPAGENVDYWVNVKWMPPANMVFDAGVTPAGQPKSQGALLSSAQLLTPETANSSHYFWRVFRNYGKDSPELTAGIEAAVTQAFKTEDEPMIQAVQDRMNGRDLMDMCPVLLSTDSGAIRARRILKQLVDDEQTTRRLKTPPLVK
jgi:phenylpropionate dioxygenase-like ring-hydroxylating dioxygenase large terminal subunit